MTRSILVAVAVLMIAPCSAGGGGRVMYGAGTISCAEWQDYRLSDKGAALQAQAWVDGYLSGYNVGSQGIDFLANKPKGIALYAWVDNYCSAHPLDLLVIAINALKTELSDRSR